MKCRLFRGCLGCVVVATALVSRAAVVDFESLPGIPNGSADPVPAASQLSTQFLTTLGVVFRSEAPYAAVINLGAGHATSGINGLSGVTAAGIASYDAAYPIYATFFDPAAPTTPAATDFVSLRIDNFGTSGRMVTLNAFDAFGNLLQSSAQPDIGGLTLTVSAPGIHSVQYIGTVHEAGAAVDDFTFHAVTPVPEPRALLVAAVLPLLIACRRWIGCATRLNQWIGLSSLSNSFLRVRESIAMEVYGAGTRRAPPVIS